MNIHSNIGKKIHNIFIEFIKFMIGTWMELSPIHYSGNFT